MFARLLEAVSRSTRGERALADIVELSRFHRIQSSPGYDAAVDWLERRLASLGLPLERIETDGDGVTRHHGFPMPEGWECRHARASLHGANGEEPIADFGKAPLSIVQRSDRASGRYPLVAIETLDELDRLDVRGKAVLLATHAQRSHERAVVARGAAGLVCDGRRLVPPARTEEHDRDSLAYTSFWWLADRPRGWGVVVSPARGAELRQRLAAGEPLEIQVDFDCARGTRRLVLLSATLPGELPGEVLITSHLCHPEPGANDNASGSAATLECARVLSMLAHSVEWIRPRRTVRFLWMPEFTGTFAWQALRPERAQATVAALNLDMVGERQQDCGSTLRLERAPFFLGSFADELLARVLTASQAWARDASAPDSTLARVEEAAYSGGSDHAPWLDPSQGVPCPMLIQWPDRYYHSNLDTPDRCDPESLALAVRAGATYAAFIAAAGAAEVGWLTDLVSRGARRRLLAALSHERADDATRAEYERAGRALASIERLAFGLPREHESCRALATALPLAVEHLEGVWESEIRDALPRTPAPVTADRGRVPVRAVNALACPIRWLAPGWDALGEARQDRLLALEAEFPGGSAALDVAWFACDGRRDVDEIATCVTREGWPVEPARLEEWFEFAVALGFCGWRAVERRD